MPLTTVTVTGKILHPDTLTPCKGSITFTPGSGVLTSAANGQILAGQATVTLATDGTFTIALPTTDNAGTQPLPNTWNWGVDFHLYDVILTPFSFALPSSPSTVDLSTLFRAAPTPGTYLVVPGPAGPVGATGATGPAGATGPQGNPTTVNGHTGASITLSAADVAALATANNLSDVPAPATARSNLGLGGAATLNVGTTAGTVAAGDDSRITGAAQKSANLSDLASPATARTNLAVPPSARQILAGTGLTGGGDLTADRTLTVAYGTTAGTAAQGNDSRITGAIQPGNAATTVAGETGYGQSSAVGVDTTYAREDHTHGTPALTSTAPATTEGIGQAAAVGTATTPARADHVHPMAAAGAPHASAVGDTAVTGVATTPAASDHVHAREAFGTVTAQTSFGAASTTGTAATVSHSDHAHGTPAMPRLDQVGAPTAAVNLNSQKITSLANGAAASDAAAFGQIPLVGAAGAGAAVALSSTDATTTNARTPTGHASTHASAGSDPVTPAAIGAATTGDRDSLLALTWMGGM